MREKLLDLMKNEGLKPGQLAELLGINPAGISHILAGRNKPGFDLLQKILRRFPQIDPDWLMLDGKTMYRQGYSAGTPGAAASADGASHLAGNAGMPQPRGLFDRQSAGMGTAEKTARADTCTDPTTQRDDGAAASTIFPPTSGKIDRPIVRIVVFYADGTFEHYAPTMR